MAKARNLALSSILILILVAPIACKEINVYDEYHNSVVMLYHKYVYKAVIDNDPMYFNYYDKTGKFTNITSSLQEASKKAMSNYGTGFFISKDGKIATNRHVVYNLTEKNENKARRYFKNIADNQKYIFSRRKDSATNQINIWSNKYYRDYLIADRNKDMQQIKAWTRIQTEAGKKVAYWEKIQSSLLEASFSVETIYLGYAVNGSYAKRLSDFKECQLQKYSRDEDIDLAVIQANDRKLPGTETAYINLEEIPEDDLKVGDEVSMLGYNLGPDISLTTTGLKVQNTEGKISQESNGVRILYSINALPGSSGSPIFSKKGKLVAINYYGYSGQAFNYGILAKHLKDLAK